MNLPVRGDAMPWYFKRAGVGKLIGKRTWGGLVGRAFPGLMDGGFVTAPGSAVFNPMTGQWEVENIGVAPDIEVELDPALVRQGKDPQLEKAIETVMAELEKNPLPSPNGPRTLTTTNSVSGCDITQLGPGTAGEGCRNAVKENEPEDFTSGCGASCL